LVFFTILFSPPTSGEFDLAQPPQFSWPFSPEPQPRDVLDLSSLA